MPQDTHDLLPDLDPLRARSGFADLVDYRLTRWQADEAEVRILVTERHLNRSGVLHGGVLCTILDAACGYAGCFLDIPGRRRRAFTLALNTQFIGSVEAGGELICVGRRVGGGHHGAARGVLRQGVGMGDGGRRGRHCQPRRF